MMYFCLIINLRKYARWCSGAQRKWKRNWREGMPKLGEAECASTPAMLWFLLLYASNGFTKWFPVPFATRDGGLCWMFETKESLEFVLRTVLQRWRSWSPRTHGVLHPRMLWLGQAAARDGSVVQKQALLGWKCRCLWSILSLALSCKVNGTQQCFLSSSSSQEWVAQFDLLFKTSFPFKAIVFRNVLSFFPFFSFKLSLFCCCCSH